MEKRIYINGEITKYLISSDGYVISTAYNGKIGDVRVLKHNHDKDGYCIITLNHKGRKYTRKIHRLVAEAFIPNPDNLPEVNHKDGNKDKNEYTNLEWVTTSENVHHAMNNNLRNYTNQETQIIEVCKLLEENIHSIKEISKLTGVSKGTIKKIHKGTHWKDISKDFNISNYNTKSYASGSDNGNTFLTEDDIEMVCYLLENELTPTEISKILDIERRIIYGIKKHKTWKHISCRYNF